VKKFIREFKNYKVAYFSQQENKHTFSKSFFVKTGFHSYLTILSHYIDKNGHSSSNVLQQKL